MTKVLLLGIDALDKDLVDRFRDDLPVIGRLREEGRILPVRSTFPPDSDTAWATISTGLSPAEHGIVRFVDPLQKSYEILNVGSRNENLRGRTFWELAAKAGRKAYAIFPHLCYPIWDMPATMVARGGAVAGAEATDPDILSNYPDPDLLLGVRGFPDRNQSAMTEYARKLRALALTDTEFALRLMRRNDWDLFFVYFSTIDAIGHFFWNYFDRTEPGYRPHNRFESVIPDTYRLYDEITSRLIEAAGNDATVIILSDHGHGGRPFKLVGVNEILREGGFLVARDLKRNPHLNLQEKGKRMTVNLVSRYGLGRVAARGMRRFPQAVQSFTRPSWVDWDRTVAYASDMSGIKSYTYGGIIINTQALNGRDYETTRSQIIELLEQKCLLPDGKPLLRFIARREDLPSGSHISRYPDIVLEFDYGYGLGWALGGPLITHSRSHNLVPGSHRGENGVFIMRGPDTVAREVVDLLDIAPTVLDLLGVPYDKRQYAGKSILRG